MRYLLSVKSVLRRIILIGWAFTVVWIYLGNLVNFHQNRIWGKQLIPVACYSTRAKEKDGLHSVKCDTDSRHLLPGQHFDFSTTGQHIPLIINVEYSLLYFSLPDYPVILQAFETLSFRGPPSA